MALSVFEKNQWVLNEPLNLPLKLKAETNVKPVLRSTGFCWFGKILP